MSSFRQSAMLIEINGIEMDVQYRYAPKKYYDYFSPPDPEEVLIDGIFLEGNYQDIFPLLERFGDEIIDQIMEKENSLI